MDHQEDKGQKALQRFRLDTKQAVQCQREFLREVLDAGKDTLFGKKYQFSGIGSIRDYQAAVPITGYEDYRTYIEQGINSKFGQYGKGETDPGIAGSYQSVRNICL